MPEIELADGARLYYEDTGPGSTGQTIAFSHGLLWNTTMFAPQIAALRGRYRCIAWDHRGQGKSSGDWREHIGMELVWQDAVQVLEKLAGGPVHFCGLSMGGFVAMRMGARRPDLVRSLILLETSSLPEPRENVPRYRMLNRVVRMLGYRVVRSRVAPIMFGKTILTDPARAEERDRLLEQMAQRKDIWRAVNGVVDRAPIDPELSRIAVPTLILVGDEDAATPPDKAERLASKIAGAKLLTIPRAGHSSTVEEPAAVTAAIEDFLTSV